MRLKRRILRHQGNEEEEEEDEAVEEREEAGLAEVVPEDEVEVEVEEEVEGEVDADEARTIAVGISTRRRWHGRGHCPVRILLPSHE